MQIVNNVRLNSWSCSLKHGSAHFTVLKHLFVWIVWSFLNTIEFPAGPFLFQHGPVLFTVLKILFVWIICSHLKPFMFMAGPRSPTSPVTTQLISRRWVTFSSWCYADCQQRSNQRLVVLPQTRSSSFHKVKAFSRLDGINLFKYHQIYGWAVLPQTRSSFFHGVEHIFLSGCYAAL